MYKSPTDPVGQRPGFYIMKDMQIEGTDHQESGYMQQIYLDRGRIRHCMKYTGGVEDAEIIHMMESCQGFRRLVHSIGVRVTAADASLGKIDFRLKCYGKKDVYNGGTALSRGCKTDGSETLISLQETLWSKDDDVPGCLQFIFQKRGELATVTVRFYLNDGFYVEESMQEEEVDTASSKYDEMIARSLVSPGNTLRLKNALEKVKRGEEVTIAFIGGSITQGAGAKPIQEKCYARLTYEGIKKKYGDKDNLRFVKAGVGGTPSQLGLLRYEEEVTKGGKVQPDIVIVEFAVNDTEDELEGGCYESLVRKIYYSGNKPAVILLFAVFEDDFNLQKRMIPVGERYRLPMVSIQDAIVEQFYDKEQRVLSKHQYFYDIYHPSNLGHRIMADCMLHLIEKVDILPYTDEQISEGSPVYSDVFEKIHFFDRKTIPEKIRIEEGGFTGTDEQLQMVERDMDTFQTPEFPNNWQHVPARSSSPFVLKLISRNLIFVFKDSGETQAGAADIWVDGEFFAEADPHFNNWTHCNSKILYNNDEAAKHTIMIQMKEPDKEFTILGFGYTV
ncbi:SGNH/GDSL hydrolase family protein [Kineothrix sp. MB12-C1]|uniref:SGNH/GDSL hydrolase family protein n=1 Tax=Kineothrix sp. MB12-C1 TaxID=3070215 RepID=UPI0027D1F497|nr:SGNH/GDSL hydrolase family protein [Kineothrix sp. MB12-C1]WMC93326.1 SGNH/GDSL hydrolase family protein [Kineothrix sp. MB12-C1]